MYHCPGPPVNGNMISSRLKRNSSYLRSGWEGWNCTATSSCYFMSLIFFKTVFEANTFPVCFIIAGKKLRTTCLEPSYLSLGEETWLHGLGIFFNHNYLRSVVPRNVLLIYSWLEGNKTLDHHHPQQTKSRHNLSKPNEVRPQISILIGISKMYMFCQVLEEKQWMWRTFCKFLFYS